MTRFLFWNLCGPASRQERGGAAVRPLLPGDRRYRNLQRVLRIFAARENLDVIVLAESPFEGRLAVGGFSEYKTTLPANRRTRCKLEIYHRTTVAFRSQRVVERAILTEMAAASGFTIHLVVAHLESALYASSEERSQKVRILASDIGLQEAENRHNRTVLVGDLNYDPHDAPITETCGLNAVASRVVAAQKMRRKCLRDPMPYFYNPMWAHLTDSTDSPPGTYYRKTNDTDCRFWYTFDQVMLRPDLLAYWQDDGLTVLSHAGKRRLLDKSNIPYRKKFSDHLPLIFSLNLP